MKIEITREAKEIAALVLELQRQQSDQVLVATVLTRLKEKSNQNVWE